MGNKFSNKKTNENKSFDIVFNTDLYKATFVIKPINKSIKPVNNNIIYLWDIVDMKINLYGIDVHYDLNKRQVNSMNIPTIKLVLEKELRTKRKHELIVELVQMYRTTNNLKYSDVNISFIQLLIYGVLSEFAKQLTELTKTELTENNPFNLLVELEDSKEGICIKDFQDMTNELVDKLIN